MRTDMMLELIRFAVNGLKRRKVRTWLTLISIVIGVSLVVTLVSVGDGLKKSVAEQIDKFGADNVIIIPGSGDITSIATQRVLTGHLWERDIERIKSVPGVDAVDGMVFAMRTTITYKGKSISSPVFGMTSPHIFDYVKTYRIAKGRYLKPGDKHVALVGYLFAHDLFDQPIDVGSTIYINGVKYRVIGVLDYIGGMNEQDDMAIIIPYDEVREFAKDELLDDEVHMIYVHTTGDTNRTVELIKQQLRNSHHVSKDEEDFSIITADTMKEEVDKILNSITLFLGIISGISLVVGTVGIINTMYMVIIERTRELGTLKALGAKNKHILTSLAIESWLIGLVGGVIGVVVGIIFTNIWSMFGLPSSVSPALGIEAIMIASLIGVVGGLIPGRRVLRLDPTEALRYE